MITRQELEGKWKQLKGQIREHWGQLTDDELQRARGDAEQLVGMIQEKTGESRREIEAYIEHLVHNGQGAVQQATETARQYVDVANKKVQEFADVANRKVQEGYRQVEEQMDAGLGNAKEMVRSRPVESIVAAFGAGIISGVVVALLLRSPNHRG